MRHSLRTAVPSIENCEITSDVVGVLIFVSRSEQFSESVARGTDNVQGKYLSMFSRQIEAIVLVILQLFFAIHAVLKIGEYLTIIHRSGGE